MAYIGNSPYQGSITGGNIVDGSIESIDLATLTNIDINSGSIDGTIIGASSAAAGSFTTLNTTSSVGIGTSSPTQKLHLSSTGNTFARIDGGAASTTGVLFDAGDGAVYYDAASNYMRLDTSGTERMRIDSSGNLLVGTTDAAVGVGNTNTGSAFGGSTGYGCFSRTGAAAQATLYVNKNTNDGTIVAFNKDGTTVGSIGVNGSDIFIGTGDTGLLFGDTLNRIQPWDTNANASQDATVELGTASNRFKDLYLSGEAKITSSGVDGTYSPILRGIYSGNSNETNTIETAVSSNGTLSGFRFNVSNGGGSSGQTEALRVTRAGTYAPAGIYLGGTGAANHLDDYETGTWTPSFTVGTHTYTTQLGNYVKVGDIVYITGQLKVSVVDSSVDASTVTIQGLPFTVSSTNTGMYGQISTHDHSYITYPTGRTSIGFYTQIGNTRLICLAAGDNVVANSLTYANWNDNGVIYFSGCYIAA